MPDQNNAGKKLFYRVIFGFQEGPRSGFSKYTLYTRIRKNAQNYLYLRFDLELGPTYLEYQSSPLYNDRLPFHHSCDFCRNLFV